MEKANATFSEEIDFDLDEESNEVGNLETQKLPTVCEEMIVYSSNTRGVISKELNHLAAILHVYAGFLWSKNEKILLLFFKKKMEKTSTLLIIFIVKGL